MKQLLRQRLMEYRWRDQMKTYCKSIITWSNKFISLALFFLLKEIVKQKGLENIIVDELVQEITPKGRGKRSIFFVHYFFFNVRLFSTCTWYNQKRNVGSSSSIFIQTWRPLTLNRISVNVVCSKKTQNK